MTDIQTQGEDPISMLVERLREEANALSAKPRPSKPAYDAAALMRMAAAEILSLSQERDRLREIIARGSHDEPDR